MTTTEKETKVERPSPLHVIVGCGEFYKKGWWNIDFVRSPENTPHGTYPDEVVGPEAWKDFSNVERLFLGHCCEHVHSVDLIPFLSGWKDACAPGAEVAVVGPDYLVALNLWRSGDLTLDQLFQRGEPGDHRSDVDWWVDFYKRELWNHPFFHKWVSTPHRTQAALQVAGFANIRPVDIVSNELYSWPLVSTASDQFAILCSAP